MLDVSGPETGRREPIGESVQGNRLVKMHSAGMQNMELLQDSDKV